MKGNMWIGKIIYVSKEDLPCACEGGLASMTDFGKAALYCDLLDWRRSNKLSASLVATGDSVGTVTELADWISVISERLKGP